MWVLIESKSRLLIKSIFELSEFWIISFYVFTVIYGTRVIFSILRLLMAILRGYDVSFPFISNNFLMTHGVWVELIRKIIKKNAEKKYLYIIFRVLKNYSYKNSLKVPTAILWYQNLCVKVYKILFTPYVNPTNRINR